MDTQKKLKRLEGILGEMESLAVAFSGGTDSTFLLKVACGVLGGNAVALTVRSDLFPEREQREAAILAGELGVCHAVIDFRGLDIEGFSQNPENRCYLCKREIFKSIVEFAKAHGLRQVADGSNLDDLGDYRPGMQAIEELGIRRPLVEASMGKEDIRVLSREMGLSTWDKPPLACLATRFPYGQEITAERLAQVAELEQFLHELGFRQARVRHHGDLARIEVDKGERARFFDPVLMDMVHEKFREGGFLYTALDLKGYRTGSMNEPIGNRQDE